MKNKIFLFLCLLTFAAPSWAVGTMIVAAYYGLGAGWTLAAFTGGMIASAFIINFAVSTLVSRTFSKKPPNIQDNGVRQQIPPASTNSLPVVYGSAYLGGTFIDAALTADQKVMYYVMAISHISPDGQFTYDTTNMYYGDRKITFYGPDPAAVESLTDGAGNVDTKIFGNLKITLFTSDQNGNITNHTIPGQMPWDNGDGVMGAGSNLDSALQWASTNRKMNGLAFAIIRLVYNRDAETTQLQQITFKVNHALYGTGVAKPGDVWYDYIRNPVYGGAIDNDLVDDISAYNLSVYSDELITFTDNQGNPSTQPRYRINGVIDTGQTVLENLDQILMAGDSWMAYNAPTGKWSVVINKAETPSFSFDDSNIIGDIRVGTIDINQAINQIDAKFPSKLNKDIPDYVFIKTPDVLLYPNEPINKYSLTFGLVNDSVQTQYLCNRILEQAREDLIVNIKTTYVGIQTNAGDVVSITNSAYGWTNKLFRAIKVNEASLPDGSLGASIQLNEYNAQVYDDKPITEFSASPNTDIPSSGYFSALSAPTVTDQLPNAAIPSFSVACVMPTTGRITNVYLYYTTVASPTSTDWYLLGTQSITTGETFTNGSTVKFTNVVFPTGTYYFAFKVGNETSLSALSTKSSGYSWSPNPASTVTGSSFVAQFSPPVLQVPYASGTPTFTGIAPQLYGTVAGGAIDFVAAQTDSDVLFTNNTWRIGGSSTTGYGSIVNTNITIGNPSDAGNYALFPAPSAMPGSPATISVPVRYKDSGGNIYQSATAICQLTFNVAGSNGADGNKTANVFLYQWSTVTPSNPSGTSTYTWATTSNASYTGGGGWSVTVPANPGTPGINLFTASKSIIAAATDVTTTVSWSSGYTVQAISQNGANGLNGLQSANPTVYQWAISIPAGPTGTSTYTWSSNSFTPTPSGWTLTGGTAPSAGYTLWAAKVNLVDSSSVSTSSINWTTAVISAAGYAGTQGPTGPTGTIGPTGSTGTTGASARVMYSRIAGSPSPVTGTVTVTGDNRPTGTQASAIWGASFNVTWYANDPDPASNNTLWQSDGIYTTGANTAWSTPYISNLKVGTLSAITTNTGALSVTGAITVGTLGSIKGGQTDYATGTGFFLGYSGGAYKFSIGSSTSYLTWDGTNLNVSGQGTFFTPSTYPNTYVALGTNIDGNVLRVYRQDNTLLPPSYIIDYAVGGAYSSSWITKTGNPNGYFNYQASNNSIVATTANITLSGTQTIDGIAVAVGSTVLVKNQTTQSQNGVYIVSAGAWTRSTTADTWAEFYNGGNRQIVKIGNGTQQNQWWYFSGATSGTVGSTAITYTQLDYGTSTYTGECLYLTPTGYSAITALDSLFANTDLVNITGSRREAQLRVISKQTSSGYSQHSSRFYSYNPSNTVVSSGIAATAGGNAFYAELGTYGPFTGTHDGLLLKTINSQVGDIFVDNVLIAKKDVSNTLFSIIPSSQPNQPAAGIFVNTENLIVTDPPAALIENIYIETIIKPDGQEEIKTVVVPNPETQQLSEQYYLANINAVGEGQINVCGENGNIQKGDLIVTSSMVGKGMKQSDDIVKNYTVARARESVTFSSSDEVKMIACFYMCG